MIRAVFFERERGGSEMIAKLLEATAPAGLPNSDGTVRSIKKESADIRHD
jgi:hypothetical protein